MIMNTNTRFATRMDRNVDIHAVKINSHFAMPDPEDDDGDPPGSEGGGVQGGG